MGFNQVAESDETIIDEVLERQRILETVINNSPVMAFLWAPEEDWPAKIRIGKLSQLGYRQKTFLTADKYGILFIPRI